MVVGQYKKLKGRLIKMILFYKSLNLSFIFCKANSQIPTSTLTMVGLWMFVAQFIRIYISCEILSIFLGQGETWVNTFQQLFDDTDIAIYDNDMTRRSIGNEIARKITAQVLRGERFYDK